jgi:hypothetical protein
MATPIKYPLINGVRHSFASVELKFAGQIFIGVKAVNYSRTRTRAEVRGNHPDPLGKTQGENVYAGDIEIYLAEFNRLETLLGAGYGDSFFSCVVTYSANGFDTIVDTITGCTIDTTEAALSQGPDPLTRKIDLKPLKILFNGIDDVLVPLVGVPA